MQTPAPPTSTLPTLAYVLLALATPVVGALSAFITYLLTRPKQSADVHKTEAEAGKLGAETRQIDSEILLRAFQRLDDLENITREQTGEIIELQKAKATVEWQLSLSEQREKIHLGEIALLNAELEVLRPKKPFEGKA